MAERERLNDVLGALATSVGFDDGTELLSLDTLNFGIDLFLASEIPVNDDVDKALSVLSHSLKNLSTGQFERGDTNGDGLWSLAEFKLAALSSSGVRLDDEPLQAPEEEAVEIRGYLCSAAEPEAADGPGALSAPFEEADLCEGEAGEPSEPFDF